MSVLSIAVRHPRQHGWWAAHVYYQRVFRLKRRVVRDDIWWRVNDWLGDRWLGPRSKDGRGHSWEVFRPAARTSAKQEER
jgi:hypothetical protein